MLCTRSKFDLSAFFRDIANAPQSALLVDYDEALAFFHRDRHFAVPYPGLTPVLEDIMDTGRTRVVLISGRRAHEVKALMGLSPAPEIWGTHGLERLYTDGTYEPPYIDPYAVESLYEADMWVDCLGLHSFVFVEHKPGCLAVHWRELADNKAREVRHKVLLGWLPIADRACLTLGQFDGGVELRVANLDKGDVVRTILSEMEIGAPLAYLGNSESAEDAFHALRDRCLNILVRSHWRETAADLWLRPPIELSAFLHDWLLACQQVPFGLMPMQLNLGHTGASRG